MTEVTSGVRLSPSLLTEIQRQYGLTEEQAKRLAGDPDFGPYVEWALGASRRSSALLEELQAATKKLQELVAQQSAA